MASTFVPNYEEAANVAAEFVTSLDNLPYEVQHLLQEIKLKEQRCQELLQEIARDQAKYARSALKNGPSSVTISSSAGGQKSVTASPTPPPGSLSTKPIKIAAAYAEIEALNNDKIELAQRLVELITFTRARLDTDLNKVRVLQGEPTEGSRNFSQPSINLGISSPHTIKRFDSLNGLNSVNSINESLRNAVSGMSSDIALQGPGYNKKRRLTTNTSIKLPSPVPSSIPSHTTVSSRSRLSRQTASRIHLEEEDEDIDADAEGDEEFEAEDAEEDHTLYCFCHKQSYGDMIGCDNPECPYQWFHITCVGVKTPLPDKWYCPECDKSRAATAEKRRNRKK